MKKKELQLENLKVSYFDSEGNHKPVVFVHGNSSSKQSFASVIESNLSERFRLLALDLPGHGESSRGVEFGGEPLYSLPYYSSVVSAFIAEMKLENPFLVGHSLRGHICIGASKRTRLSGLFIFQAPPLETPSDMAKGFHDVSYLPYFISANVSKENVEEIFQNLYPSNCPQFLIDDFLRTDPACRENVGQALGAADYIGEVSILKNADFPVCIAHAENDGLIRGEYIESLGIPTLWKGRVIPLRSSNHYAHVEKPEYFIDLLDSFLSD